MSAEKKACGCAAPKDPYQESLQVVWHDPTRYDAQVHGPEYLPKVKTANIKVARNTTVAQAFLRDLAKKGVSPLASLLVALRAAAFLHQTHHWQTSGPNFYADHLLFDRLYNESLPFIDQVAERTVGVDGVNAVDARVQAQSVVDFFYGSHFGGPVPMQPSDLMVANSLAAEMLLVDLAGLVLEKMEGDGTLTNGTDNLLQGVSDLHEGFVYLLQQRAPYLQGAKGPYDYSR